MHAAPAPPPALLVPAWAKLRNVLPFKAPTLNPTDSWGLLPKPHSPGPFNPKLKPLNP